MLSPLVTSQVPTSLSLSRSLSFLSSARTAVTPRRIRHARLIRSSFMRNSLQPGDATRGGSKQPQGIIAVGGCGGNQHLRGRRDAPAHGAGEAWPVSVSVVAAFPGGCSNGTA